MHKLFILGIFLFSLGSVYVCPAAATSSSDPIIIAIKEVNPNKLVAALKNKSLTVQARAAYIEMIDKIINQKTTKPKVNKSIEEMLELRKSAEIYCICIFASPLLMYCSGIVSLIPHTALRITEKSKINVIKAGVIASLALGAVGIYLIKKAIAEADDYEANLNKNHGFVINVFAIKQILENVNTI
jgi:hypothetical protein